MKLLGKIASSVKSLIGKSKDLLGHGKGLLGKAKHFYEENREHPLMKIALEKLSEQAVGKTTLGNIAKDVSTVAGSDPLAYIRAFENIGKSYSGDPNFSVVEQVRGRIDRSGAHKGVKGVAGLGLDIAKEYIR